MGGRAGCRISVIFCDGMLNLQPQTILLLLGVSTSLKAEAGPKGSPWDWQRQYPVFQPYSKPEHELPHQPQFLPSARNLTVTEGEDASLPCRVKNLFQHYTVSWIRASDVTVLSVGHLTFSSDERFSVLEIPRPRLSASDWSLTVKNASVGDSGMYECQVNTDPKMNRKFHLTVKGEQGNTQKDSPYYSFAERDEEKKSVLPAFEQTHSRLKKHQDLSNQEDGFPMWLHDNGCICPKPQFRTHKARKGSVVSIPGGGVQHVVQGGGMILECLVSGLLAPPKTLHWLKGGQKVTAKERPGLSIETERLAASSRAVLVFGSAEVGDTGNYTCVADETTQTVLFIVTPESSLPWASPLISANSSPNSNYNSFNYNNFTFPLLIFLLISFLNDGC